eukprot:200879-Pyramimonas_sp.AAC.1
MKWMHWQLKPVAVQRAEAQAGMVQAEERIAALEKKQQILADDMLYQRTVYEYHRDLFREAVEARKE